MEYQDCPCNQRQVIKGICSFVQQPCIYRFTTPQKHEIKDRINLINQLNEYGQRTYPAVGDAIQCDEWKTFEFLLSDDGFRDESFPGCQFRVKLHSYHVAVNVVITGKAPKDGWYRCKVEFVGDGEPSTFTGGKIHINS